MRVRPLCFAIRHRWLALLAICAGWALVGAMPVNAAPGGFPAGQVCHIHGPESLTYAYAARSPDLWDCTSDYPEWRSQREIIRHDLRARQTRPQYLEFDRQPFGRLEIAVSDAAGRTAQAVYREHDVALAGSGLRGFVELPQTSARATFLVITVDRTDYPEAFVNAQLLPEPPARPVAGAAQLLAALLCGLLLAPLFFDLGFNRTLRQPFPLFHAIFCLSASIQTAVISGLVPAFATISLTSERLIGAISFDLMLVAIVLFVRDFLERTALLAWHRKLLLGAAAMPVAATLVDYFSPMIPSDAVVYYLMLALYAGLIASLLVVFFVAWRRGSGAVRYVSLGLLPLLTVGILRVGGGMFPALAIDFDEVWAQNFALAFEVVVTSFAVAGRFLAIKLERDRAVDAARSFEAICEQDPLTGLLNRRALESRFEALRAEGFTALAVIDLDHFKAINDTYGHQLGDEVLVRAARALRDEGDPDLLAFRIGGEEFLILLRGKAKQSRAEARRRAICSAIAGEFPLVDRKVTASMGYIEASAGAIASANFEALYERADRLLYEAKERGRDITVAERVKVFWRREDQRRGERSAA